MYLPFLKNIQQNLYFPQHELRSNGATQAGLQQPCAGGHSPEPDHSAKHVAGDFIPAAQGAAHKPGSSMALGAVQPGSCREKRCLLARAEGCCPREAVLTPVGLLCYCQP